MPADSVERIQAASSGMNTLASPDYVQPTEAPLVQNMLPGRPGRLVMRGSITNGIDINGGTLNTATAVWAFDDTVLLKSNDGTSVKTWRVTSTFSAKSNVTATLVESPLDSRHARYGDYVYGAIVDAASPQLGKWDGGATPIVPMANAPFQFTDLQVYAQRLFVLGGSVPGTTTPRKPKTLYWGNPPTVGTYVDLSLLASWQDTVSGLTNQIALDMEDTPVALAGCGRFMAIIGTRSINILTGTGTSSFSVRNITRNWGCTDFESVVEVDDGFYFMSERGFAFCDGVTVTAVSDAIRDLIVGTDVDGAAMFGDGYIAISQRTGPRTWLYHVPSRSWTQLTCTAFSNPDAVPYNVHRSLNYPLMWDGTTLWRGDDLTIWDGVGYDGLLGVTSSYVIPARVKTRIARLASPSSSATTKRVLVDYALGTTSAWWAVTVRDDRDATLATGTAAGEALVSTFINRSRAQFDVYSESSTAYLDIVYTATGTPNNNFAELYDCWLEFEPGRVTPGF